MQNSIKIVEKQIKQHELDKARCEQAERIRNEWLEAKRIFDEVEGQLINAFVKLEHEGTIEIITTAATHAFLPAFQSKPNYVRYQIALGIESFQRATGVSPKGFWIPECGYFSGLEEVLDSF